MSFIGGTKADGPASHLLPLELVRDILWVEVGYGSIFCIFLVFYTLVRSGGVLL